MRCKLIFSLYFYLISLPLFATQVMPNKVENGLLINHVNIVDIANDRVIYDQFVLIDDGKIKLVSSQQPSNTNNIKQIDGRGKYLMAGLIDMHVHVFQPADLYQLLRYGVTTARVMYGWPQTLEYRDAVKQHKLAGPDLVVASPIINQKSPYASSNMHRFVNSVTQAQDLVNDYAKQGFDLIKTYDGLKPNIFTAIVEAAQKNGLQVAGHPSFYLTIDDYIAAQPQTIEHIEMLYQASLDYSRDGDKLKALATKLAQQSAPITTTLVVYDNLARLAVEKQAFIEQLPTQYIHPLIKHLEQSSVDYISSVDKPQNWRSKADYLGEMARVLNENNVPLVIGSDGGVGYTINGKSTIDEMMLLAKYGMPHNDILKAATITPAKALARQQELGQILPGYIANLILLESDPRKDLSVLRNPRKVIKEGAVFDSEKLEQLKQLSAQHMSNLDTAVKLFLAL